MRQYLSVQEPVFRNAFIRLLLVRYSFAEKTSFAFSPGIPINIEKVKELGVKFETNVVIGKSTTIDQLMEEEGFEAVFIGSGAGLPMFMGIPGENANDVLLLLWPEVLPRFFCTQYVLLHQV